MSEAAGPQLGRVGPARLGPGPEMHGLGCLCVAPPQSWQCVGVARPLGELGASDRTARV